MGDAGFDGNVEIVHAESQHAVHARQVDGHTPLHRVDVPFERRPGAERHDRRTMTGGGLHHRTHLLRRQRKDDDVRVARLMPRLAVTVLLDLRGCGGTTIADARAKIGDESGARVSGQYGGQCRLPGTLHQAIETPDPGTSRSDIEERETERHRVDSAVVDRHQIVGNIESLSRGDRCNVNVPERDGHLAAGEERGDPGEQTEHHQQTANGLDHTRRTLHARQRRHLPAEPPEHLLQSVTQEQKAKHDTK